MDKKKNIIVWDQFEQTKKEEPTGSNQDEIPTYSRNYDGNLTKISQVKLKLKQFKHIFIAMFSAIIVGSILGFLMLNILTTINQPKNNDGLNQNAVSHPSDDQENNAKNSNNEQQFTLQSMAGYVVQVGVFNQKDNAENWQQTYESAGFFTTIWERESQHFLFAGVSENNEDAQMYKTMMEEEGLDVFIKEWRTDELEIQMTEDEYDWIKSFQQLWLESVQLSGKKEKVDFQKWTDLMAHDNGQLLNTKELQEKIAEQLNGDLVKSNHLLEQQFLLEIWYEYATIYNL